MYARMVLRHDQSKLKRNDDRAVVRVGAVQLQAEGQEFGGLCAPM